MGQHQPAPALPQRATADLAATGLTCPDCGGSLSVRAEGASGYLYFRCRIGHVFALDSLVAAKEDGVERCLWVAVTALEELLALGRDLQRPEGAFDPAHDPADLADRLTRLQADAETVRRVVERNRALALRVNDGHVAAC